MCSIQTRGVFFFYDIWFLFPFLSHFSSFSSIVTAALTFLSNPFWPSPLDSCFTDNSISLISPKQPFITRPRLSVHHVPLPVQSPATSLSHITYYHHPPHRSSLSWLSCLWLHIYSLSLLGFHFCAVASFVFLFLLFPMYAFVLHILL